MCKAFDLINHDILLAKLKIYGVDDGNLQLFRSYLADRQQYVNINGCTSSPLGITHGVPQGSILGPLLFLTFINDLPQVISNSTVDVYADDTTFSSSAHCTLGTTAVEAKLQEDIDSLCAWSTQNRMVLNAGKTKSILVTGKRLKSRVADPSLKLQANGTAIEQVIHQKLLGVTIDQELTFKEHVDKLCKKLSKKIGLLKKLCTYLPIEERLLFYNALIKPVMMYGSIVWTYCSKEDLMRVFRLQKRAARVILVTLDYKALIMLLKQKGGDADKYSNELCKGGLDTCRVLCILQSYEDGRG
ncbi:putative RNA-directed DNA polymerase from transposon BS [Stylophora pistillata]|uniref:Putative RNA-directed DNA polymerase from transposon BS n=1 Tax=Stylophora pistillata TaxID=50429 RepID=A0A2B4RPY8_STYPI|nr:putative RNA-directed DNA polymerase from transposon BS [Stylophora pistillata]